MNQEMNKTYEPKSFEDRIYDMWMANNDFYADAASDKPPFSIVLPPPNITGRLHEGHALNHTMQDIIIRFKRMQGFETLWLPGTDHASIATEVKILDKILKEEGRTKADLTREEFLDKAWAWKHEYGGAIVNQMKKLGNSCDWSRERFTMDEGCSQAVLEVFIRLYEEGLIYRGNRLINWCPDCKTSLSDAEVDHEDETGAFYDIAYAVEGSPERLTISTTRPETMLGDTAIAVHPEDDRYRNLVGKTAIVPLVGRRIPIVADSYVDRELGTGALKVTPAHDPNDYEIGKRHQLDTLNIFTEEAAINEVGGVYQGLDRYEARKKIVQDLKEAGHLVHEKVHVHAVGQCYRCHHQIEPRISDQWFVQMKELADMAKQSAANGEMKFIPERYIKTYNNWLDGIRDWCISRQLWWGHRIPAYYCQSCGEMVVAREMPDRCASCGSERFAQDPDVLDTWFSSALWPFSTMGWPEQTPTLAKFYPTQVLVTGYDIIFFWVIRMMFSGLKFMQESPFEVTLINGIVRDAQGRKISKSLNNGTDPLDVIEQFGADALRFMLISGTATGNDTRFSMERVETARNFANKLWNAARFVLKSAEDKPYALDMNKLTLSDRWILNERNQAVRDVTDYLDKYELGMAADRAMEFAWGSFCDWYIELSKKRLYSEDGAEKEQVLAVLLQVLSDLLKLLHPFMPFITEEIWQHLPHKQSDLIKAEWPQKLAVSDQDVSSMATLMEAIRRIRNLRAEMDIPQSKRGRLYVKANAQTTALFIEQADAFRALASVSDVLKKEEELSNASVLLLGEIELSLPLDDLIDYQKEYERLRKESERVRVELERAEAKLSNSGFVAKAPAELIAAEQKKVNDYKNLQSELERKLAEVERKLS